MPEDEPTILPLQSADPSAIGSYTILGRLGIGGMGAVYLGRDASGLLAAVKVVRPELAAQPQFRARFEREVRAAGAIGGRYTALVLDSDLVSSPQWVATQYVPGPTLANHVEARGALAPEQAELFALGLAGALHDIHAKGLVHRDLKPSNVILAADGPKVIDFGISQAADATSLTQTGAYVGTLAWMAPEQVTGAEVSPATDVFAWGLVAAYAALGRHPYGDGRPEAIAFRIVNHEPDLVGLQEPLLASVHSALAYEPSQRITPAELIRSIAGEEKNLTHVHGAIDAAWDATLVGDALALPVAPRIHSLAGGPLPVAPPGTKGHSTRNALVGGAVGLLALVMGAAALGLLPAAASEGAGGAGAAGPVVDQTTAARDEAIQSPAPISAPEWNQDVDTTNVEEFNQWLIDHEGQVVRIDASINDGEWDNSTEYPWFYVNMTVWGWDSAITIAPSSTGRRGYDGGVGAFAGLGGYYAVNPSHFVSTSGWRHSLQALDTAEAMALLNGRAALPQEPTTQPANSRNQQASVEDAIADWYGDRGIGYVGPCEDADPNDSGEICSGSWESQDDALLVEIGAVNSEYFTRLTLQQGANGWLVTEENSFNPFAIE